MSGNLRLRITIEPLAAHRFDVIGIGHSLRLGWRSEVNRAGTAAGPNGRAVPRSMSRAINIHGVPC
ncbi:MAG: hypothetical protein EBZ89_15520 [Chloroflexi bacterium]|nr:hypothetical protein [Chloroflexota bacterium]